MYLYICKKVHIENHYNRKIRIGVMMGRVYEYQVMIIRVNQLSA